VGEGGKKGRECPHQTLGNSMQKGRTGKRKSVRKTFGCDVGNAVAMGGVGRRIRKETDIGPKKKSCWGVTRKGKR